MLHRASTLARRTVRVGQRASTRRPFSRAALTPRSLAAPSVGGGGLFRPAAAATTRFLLGAAAVTGSLYCYDQTAACSGAEETAAEPSTGILFETHIHRPCRDLLGTGCRWKYGMFKVYAIALYAHQNGGALADRIRSKPLPELLSDSQFWTDFIAGEFTKTLHIKMARSVSAKTMADALEGALRPRVQKRGGDMGALEKFRQIVMCDPATGKERPGFSTGSELVFTLKKGKALEVTCTVAGEPEGETVTIEDATVAWALFDTYLGPEAVETNIREAFARGVQQKLLG